MTDKQLWLLAGGNGAGKSTFYHTRLEPLGLPFVNADVIARELFATQAEQYSYAAARIAEEMRQSLLLEGRSFCFETVFSHPSKIDFVARAKALGYEIILVLVHLNNTQLNKARVSQRVSAGGHNVPDDKIEARIPRTLEHMQVIFPLCDQVHILDNSSAADPFRRVAVIREGVLRGQREQLPGWVQSLLQGIPESPA